MTVHVACRIRKRRDIYLCDRGSGREEEEFTEHLKEVFCKS